MNGIIKQRINYMIELYKHLKRKYFEFTFERINL